MALSFLLSTFERVKLRFSWLLAFQVFIYSCILLEA